MCFYYEEKKKDSKRNFYSDLFIFDNISGGVVCIWENRDSGSRLYVCMYGMSFRRGCSDTGNSESIKLGRGMYIAMYCCILRNESGLWHTFSDKIFLENFLENFLEKMIFWKGVFLL